MSRELTPQEIHNLAMNLVGKQLEEDGFEFMAVNSKPKKDPQFVCLKDKILHFIVVRYVLYPDNPREFDKELMEKVKNQAEKFKALTYYAGVGLSNAEDRQLPLILNAPYVVEYEGLVVY